MQQGSAFWCEISNLVAHLHISALAEQVQADLLLVRAGCNIQRRSSLPIPDLQRGLSCFYERLDCWQPARAAGPATITTALKEPQ